MLKIKIQRAKSPWKVTAALACFVSAVVAGVMGSVFTTGWILSAQLHPRLYQLGLTLLILAIPMLILGGHCLDLMETSRKNRDGVFKTK